MKAAARQYLQATSNINRAAKGLPQNRPSPEKAFLRFRLFSKKWVDVVYKFLEAAHLTDKRKTRRNRER